MTIDVGELKRGRADDVTADIAGVHRACDAVPLKGPSIRGG